MSPQRYSRIDHLSFADAQAYEQKMLSDVARAGKGWLSRVWTTDTALIVPYTITNQKGFETAAEDMKAQGWPVHVRQTGGDVTPQAPGMVNVSLAFCVPRHANLSIQSTYEMFCQPILDFLQQEHGVTAGLSSVEGAFCDGAYNVVVDGKKLAGTAQRWRLCQTPEGDPAVSVLGHAAVIWDLDIDSSIAATNAFYRSCAMDRVIDLAQHVSMARLFDEKSRGEVPVPEALDAFLQKNGPPV